MLTASQIRAQRFPTALKGYDAREVDAFLDRVALALDDVERGRTSPLTLDDVKTVTFPVRRSGYSIEAVDAFLIRVGEHFGAPTTRMWSVEQLRTQAMLFSSALGDPGSRIFLDAFLDYLSEGD
jgi:DivIVA domain-containing protein